MGDGAATDKTFPTYGELAQTQGWATAASSPVRPAGGPDQSSQIADPNIVRYKERALLGEGGMGKVMLAHDARVGRDVAVKQLHGNRELSTEEHRRFLREARVQGQLEHPSIVPVYDIDQRADGSVFFTMRRVVGRTLHQIIDDLKVGNPSAVARYTKRELLTAFATICLTVDYAHTRGVIHRDLKPANVMLGDYGEVYVLDWGLARILGESGVSHSSETPPIADDRPSGPELSATGALLGTPLYMAPEQFADARVGPAADVFALGAILFELLTLERLRDASTIYAPPDANPSTRAPHRQIDPELGTICVRATEADPSARYASPRALQEEVIAYLEGDRDREQRKTLAAGHATRAREALDRAASAPNESYEAERGDALRELTRAIALHPTNQSYHAALASTLAQPPREIPAEVQAELRAETASIVKRGTRHGVWGMLSWFIFVPIILAIGVVDTTGLAWISGAALFSLVLAVVADRRAVIPQWIQIAMLTATLAAGMFLSRLYGPLVLMPTLLISYTITVQSHPWRTFRTFGLWAGIIAMLVPVALELLGLWSSSYSFADGRMTILPDVIAMPRSLTIVFLALSNVACLVAPCLFISNLRRDLSEMQTRQLLQKWQFRRLGDELVQQTSTARA